MVGANYAFPVMVKLLLNSADPDLTASQKQSDLGLHCLLRQYCQKHIWNMSQGSKRMPNGFENMKNMKS